MSCGHWPGDSVPSFWPPGGSPEPTSGSTASGQVRPSRVTLLQVLFLLASFPGYTPLHKRDSFVGRGVAWE